METIVSRHNALVKAFRELARGRDGARMLLDGGHLVAEALDAGVRVTAAAVAADILAPPDDERRLSIARLAKRLAQDGIRVVSVSDSVMAAMSPVQTPSGIVAIAEFNPPGIDHTMKGAQPFVPIVAAVQDPGNLGAIVRTAEAAGATGLVVCAPSADPYGWKALRGAMGSTFRMPVPERATLPEALQAVKHQGLRVVAAVPRGGTPMYACDFRRPIALLLGGEGPGLSDAALELADRRVSIPMRQPVESLNVAVSAAVILYEAYRQRLEVAP
jgi:TrmH family RNA methyltransferase